ncbi:MAG: hypothetical protein WA063_03060 [Minisyncoccia bacterium]
MSLKETIIGNARIGEILERSHRTGKLAHAYLFSGPEHIGKRTLALHLGRLILNDDAGNIEKNIDLMIVRPVEDKKEITIDQIRELQKKLSLSPHSSDYKVAIIEQADRMTEQASNALLKTLEEPSKTTILLLLTSNSGIVLETIRSRCQILKFLPVKKDLLENFLLGRGVKSPEIGKIIEVAGYKPGKIVELIENMEKMTGSMAELDYFSKISDRNIAEKMEKAELMSENETVDIINILDLWTVCLRKKLIDKFKLKNIPEKTEILEIRKKIGLISKIKEDILGKNVNIRLAIESLILEI